MLRNEPKTSKTYAQRFVYVYFPFTYTTGNGKLAKIFRTNENIPCEHTPNTQTHTHTQI